jgi:hypothetical protein
MPTFYRGPNGGRLVRIGGGFIGSPGSGEVQPPPEPDPVSVAPGALLNMLASATSSAGISVSWDAPSTGTTPFTYNLRHRLQGTTSWTTLTGQASPRVISGLAAASSYEIQGQAVNSAEGPWTATTPEFVSTLAGQEEPPPDGGSPDPTTGPFTLAIAGTGAPAGSVMTFGHGFEKGYLKPGDPLTWKDSSNVTRETQYDTAGATYYTDGSIRWCPLHVVLPSIAGGAKNVGTLSKTTTTAGAARNLATALASHTAAIEIKNGGNVFNWTLADALADLPSARWFQGNLKAETRVKMEVPRAATGGLTDCELWVDISIDKAGVVGLVFQVRNVAIRGVKGSQGTATYDIKVTGNGVQQLNFAGIVAPLYTIFSRACRFNAAGAAQAPVGYVHVNTVVMSKTGIAGHYDQQLGISETVLTNYQNQRDGASWNTPYSNRGLRKYMPGTGGDETIGFTTRSQAVWMISGDRRVGAHAVEQAEAALTIPWYCWDHAAGRWLNPVDQPFRRVPGLDSTFASSANTYGWTMDVSHQGDYFTIPYALSARRAFLDGLNGQVAWAVMWRPTDYNRQMPSANNTDNTDAARAARLAAIGVDGKGTNPRRNMQARGYGWTMRAMVGAVALTPPSEMSFGTLWNQALKGHYAMLTAERGAAEANQRGLHGMPTEWVYENPSVGVAAPWQFVFIGMQHVRAAYLEIPNAADHLAWGDNYWSGIFSHPNLNAADMTRYNIKACATKAPTDVYNTTEWRTPAQIQASIGTTPYTRQSNSGTYGPNYSHIDTGGTGYDYETRQVAFLSQLQDALAYFSKSTTKAAAAMAFFNNLPAQTKENIRISANQFKNGTWSGHSSMTRRGTTRA